MPVRLKPKANNERVQRARGALRAIAKGLRELQIVSIAIPPFTQLQTTGMHDWSKKAMILVERFDDILAEDVDITASLDAV